MQTIAAAARPAPAGRIARLIRTSLPFRNARRWFDHGYVGPVVMANTKTVGRGTLSEYSLHLCVLFVAADAVAFA